MTNLLLQLIKAGNYGLALLGLRKANESGGVVYDSNTKQPIDPAMVKLIDATTGEVVETCTTDLQGRYGFLKFPGRYQIFVHRSNYLFPSQKITGFDDGIYDNIYHGELFELTGASDIIAFNIPLDPQNPDWNQQEKLQSDTNTNWPFIKLFIKKLVLVLFWFGAITALFLLIQTRSIIALWVVVAYAVLIILSKIFPRPRGWGRVIAKNKQSLSNLTIEASPKDIPDLVTAKARIHDDGKFFLRLQPGVYNVKIKLKDEALKTFSIKIFRSKIITNQIKL